MRSLQGILCHRIFSESTRRFVQNKARSNSATSCAVHSPGPIVNVRGFTLVEMLVAMAVTLVILAALANIFSWLGNSVNDTRATIDMASRLRHTRNQLQLDLAGITSPMLPPLRPEAGLGYFQYAEGNVTDLNAEILLTLSLSSSTLVPKTAVGDYDDVLAFTTRSRGEPFVSRAGQSQVAEVIWFAVQNPADGSRGEPGMRTLYRRVMIVRPSSGITGPTSADDLSTGYNGTAYVPNTLGDLTKPERRSFHSPSPTPFFHQLFPRLESVSVQISSNTIRLSGGGFEAAGFRDGMSVSVSNTTDNNTIYTISNVADNELTLTSNAIDENSTATLVGLPILGGSRKGEDVMLTNVLAWDVRAFDPTAKIYNHNNNTLPTTVVVAPGDAGWPGSSDNNLPSSAGWTMPGALLGQGAYVDLGYIRDLPSASPAAPWLFNNPSNFSALNFLVTRPPASRTLPVATYDTWSYHYEQDGLDQDNRDGDGDSRTGADEGTDGFDNGGINGVVDDAGERETSPPYSVPLRGIQIRIRVYEPDSRAIREVSVLQDFVPE